ncbi:MAG: GTP 3',8-cyclase MoaA [Bacteroidia bacterium]
MQSLQLTDTFGRNHNYLRISLTDACNLRCNYCMPNENIKVTPTAKLMQVEEIAFIADTFVKLGVTKIRLTGGEPLVRKDAKEIIERLSILPVELTISTNAVFVDEYIETFKKSTIKSVNISLDTLNADEFLTITKRNTFAKIMANIHLLLLNNFKVKINVVVMKGINEHVILDFVQFAKDYPVEVRFIEFMPFKGNGWQKDFVFSYQEMLEKITRKHNVLKLADALNDTTKKYKIDGCKGSFAFISTITAPFCDNCNRLRLTADGKVKNCLFDTKEIDILSALRSGKDIKSLILQSVHNKKQERGGLFNQDSTIDTQQKNRAMIKIGG